MSGQMTHLDTDVLAEFRAGLITGRRGARITAHLAGCARELNGGASRSDLNSVKSLGAQPPGGRLKVGVGRSKLRTKLLGSQPGVMLWRIESKLIIH